MSSIEHNYLSSLIDPSSIAKLLEMVVAPGTVIEIRVLKVGRTPRKTGGRTVAGYFDYDHIDRVAIHLGKLERAGFAGAYFTLNPVQPALLSRSANQLIDARTGSTTKDSEIVARRLLLFDFDPVRNPPDVPATDAEHDAALAIAHQYAADREGDGWPAPILIDSGNGAHLLYAVDLPAESPLPRATLAAAAKRYDTAAVHVDQSVHNAARISRLPGTRNCKGSHTADRPHRMAKVVSAPEALTVVTAEQLQAFCPLQEAGNRNPFVQTESGSGSTPYGLAALREESMKVAAAEIGHRHTCLNRGAFAMGQLIGGGQLDEQAAVEEMVGAGIGCGLAEPEVSTTVRDAIAKGKAQPRQPVAKKHARPAGAGSLAPPGEFDHGDDIASSSAIGKHPASEWEWTGDHFKMHAGGMFELGDGYGENPLEMIANFAARIVAEETVHTGGIPTKWLIIQALVANRRINARVSAAEFSELSKWVVRELGPAATVVGNAYQKVRTVIQFASTGYEKRQQFAHTGWINVDGNYGFASASGILGMEASATISVALPENLRHFQLPSLADEASRLTAWRAAVQFLDVAPPATAVPLLLSVVRAVIGDAPFSVWLWGASGTRKTAVCAVLQAFFGARFRETDLPASWQSTGNGIIGICNAAKDCVVVVDDFAPVGDIHRATANQATASTVLRAVGNRQARTRANRDGTVAADLPPRAFVVATAECLPLDHSIRARCVLLEMARGSVNLERLSACQRAAADGTLAAATSSLILSLAPRLPAIQAEFQSDRLVQRAARGSVFAHARNGNSLAELWACANVLLRHVREIGMSEAEAAALDAKLQVGLNALALGQGHDVAATEPAERFLELVIGALAAGVAHVTNAEGKEPNPLGNSGWSYDSQGNLQPRGRAIGWVADSWLYLRPDAALSAAIAATPAGSPGVGLSTRELGSRLKERGLLLCADANRGTTTVRRSFQGANGNVWCFSRSLLLDGLPDLPNRGDAQ